MFTTEEISLSQLCSLPCVTGTTGRISHQWKSQTALDMIKHRPKHRVAIFLKNIVQNIAIMMPLTMLIAHPYTLVKRGLSTRSPLRRYPASCSCDAGKETKMRKRNPLSCKHIAVVYSYFSVWSSEIFLLLTINEYQLVSRLDSVSRSWRFILWDLEFKFGSIQLDGHFCLFNNI